MDSTFMNTESRLTPEYVISSLAKRLAGTVAKDLTTGKTIATCRADQRRLSDVADRLPEQEDQMIKIEAIIRPNKFESVKTALIRVGIEGTTVSEVRGQAAVKRATPRYSRGGNMRWTCCLQKIKVELVLQDDVAEKAVESILGHSVHGIDW